MPHLSLFMHASFPIVVKCVCTQIGKVLHVFDIFMLQGSYSTFARLFLTLMVPVSTHSCNSCMLSTTTIWIAITAITAANVFIFTGNCAFGLSTTTAGATTGDAAGVVAKDSLGSACKTYCTVVHRDDWRIGCLHFINVGRCSYIDSESNVEKGRTFSVRNIGTMFRVVLLSDSSAD